jgi:signal peptidase I
MEEGIDGLFGLHFRIAGPIGHTVNYVEFNHGVQPPSGYIREIGLLGSAVIFSGCDDRKQTKDCQAHPVATAGVFTFDKAQGRRLTSKLNMFGNRNKRVPPFGGIQISDDQDIEVHRPREAARRHLWSEGRLLVRDLIFALIVAALAVVFIIQPVKVEGTSMLPHLHDGERIFVNKLIYYDEYRWMPRIQRGDIVVFWFPDDPSKSYIKRVIGLPNDMVEMYEGRVRVNGRELDETYLDSRMATYR